MEADRPLPEVFLPRRRKAAGRPSPAARLADLAARFRLRAHELDEAHRGRGPLAENALLPPTPHRSWLWQWATSWATALPALPLPPVAPPLLRGECALTYLGHATVAIRYGGLRFVTDPCLGRSLFGLCRRRPARVPAGSLAPLDVVLVSHSHADHLHRATLATLDHGATLVAPADLGAERLGFAHTLTLRPGDRARLGGVEIVAIGMRHRVGRRGQALGYLLRGAGPSVFFVGDSGYCPSFYEVGARFRPEVAILPISGYRPLALRHDHLSPLDALQALADLGAQLFLPIHHGSFALGYEPIDEPLAWLRRLAQARRLLEHIAWLAPGESCVVRQAPLHSHAASDIGCG